MSAVDPLCQCGIRGCEQYAQHSTAYVATWPAWRRKRRTRKR